MERPLLATTHLLSDIASLLGSPSAKVDCEITGLTNNSSEVEPGDIFLAFPGSKVHGANFAKEAKSKGALAVVTDVEGAAVKCRKVLREGAEFRPCSCRAHIDLYPDFLISRTTNSPKLPHPASCLDSQIAFASSLVTKQCLAETADAIARNFGLGPIRVQEHHASIISFFGRREGENQTISADTSVPVTQRARQLRING